MPRPRFSLRLLMLTVGFVALLFALASGTVFSAFALVASIAVLVVWLPLHETRVEEERATGSKRDIAIELVYAIVFGWLIVLVASLAIPLVAHLLEIEL